MILYNPNASQLADITVNDDSYRYRAIMGENALTLTFSLSTFTDILLGTYCIFQAETYTLNRPATFVKVNTKEYEYTLVMSAAASALDKYKFIDVIMNGSVRGGTNRVKFSNTAKPQEHLKMLVDNLNIRESGWIVGSCIASTEKVISFNHNNCSEALKLIADTFKTEFEIVGKTISLKKVEYNKTLNDALPLSYGFGNGFISGVKRDNFDSSRAIEKLYVQGGSRNINASTYGSKDLLLPKSQAYIYNGRAYASDADGLYIYRTDKALSTFIEESLDLSDIYPSRVGTASTVVVVDALNNFYDIIDSTIGADLDYNACLMPGEKMTIIFQTGMLEGKEFDCDYDNVNKRFGIVPVEIDGVKMPNATYIPVAGDKYAIFGISLPTAYVCSNAPQTGASWDMMKEAVAYLYDNEDSKFSFTGELDGIWSKSDWVNIGGKIKLGGFVSFTDSQFQATAALIRIVGIKDFINNPYSPQIELSNVTVQGSVLSSVIGKVEKNEVDLIDNTTEIKRFARRGFADSKQTAQMLVSAGFSGFTGMVSPLTVQTMQLIVGDESLQYFFVSGAGSIVQVLHDEHYNKTVKQFISAAGYLQHKSIGITDVKSSRTSADFKTWQMTAYTSAVLDVASKSYYVYAKVNRTTTAGTFILSETAISFKSDVTFYHLLVGILNSEVDGDRSYSAMYGFSEITPSRLTTQKIVSPDGQTYFDLAAGEIGGNIKFRASDNSLKSVNTEVGNAQSAAGTAQSAANAATTAAGNAQTAANTANGLLSDISSDNVLTPNEKQVAKKEWDIIAAEYNTTVNQANQYAIEDPVTLLDFEAYYLDLYNYITPLLLDLAVNSTIVGSTFRAVFRNYYTSKTNLLYAISTAIKSVSDAAKAEADAVDYLKTALAGSTEISGGLTATNVIIMKTLAGIISGGFSGLANDPVGIWTGGTYANAIADTLRAFKSSMLTGSMDKKDGSGHRAFGKFAWDIAGNVFFKGIIEALSGKIGSFDIIGGRIVSRDSAGAEKLVLSTAPLTGTPSTLEGSYTLAYSDRWEAYQTDGGWNPVYSGTFHKWVDQYIGNDSLESAINHQTVSFDLPYAANIQYRLGLGALTFGTPGAVQNHTYSVSARVYLNNTLVNSNLAEDTVFYVNGSGTVRIEVYSSLTVSLNDNTSTTWGDYPAADFDILYQETTKKTELGSDGFYSYWSATTYLYFSNALGLIIRGATDIPAGIGGVSISNVGAVLSFWGKIPAAANVVKSGSNFTITHNIGDTNYSVLLTPKSTNIPYFLDANRLANSIVVTCAGGFDFILVRTQ